MKEAKEPTSQSVEVKNDTIAECELVPPSLELPPLSPEVLQGAWEVSGPIVLILVLCRFFTVLTRFVEACQPEG